MLMLTDSTVIPIADAFFAGCSKCGRKLEWSLLPTAIEHDGENEIVREAVYCSSCCGTSYELIVDSVVVKIKEGE